MQELTAYIAHLKAHPEVGPPLTPLFDLIEQQAQRIVELETEVVNLHAEVKSLRAQLNQNSQNSHKPPSSDGYRKAAAIPKPKSGRRGGQRGHRGRTLDFAAVADTVDEQRPAQCSGCGHPLLGVEAETLERRQLFALPPPRLSVHEFRRPVCRCPGCGQRNQVPFPVSVPAPVQYGASVWALSTLLHNDYAVPVAKVSQLFADLFGYRLNEATVEAANRRTAAALAESNAAIEAQLGCAPVVHADETGLRCAGRRHWLHVRSSETLTHFRVQRQRGVGREDLLRHFSGCLIHDCWASYFRAHRGAHGLCNGHLLRELQALAEQGAAWAAALQQVLLEAHRYKQADGVVPAAVRHRLKQRYFALLRQGVAAHPLPAPRAQGRGRQRRGKARSLIDRLLQHQGAVWRFAEEAAVPFTNNQAERDLRMVKVKQKVNGGFRTVFGADLYAQVRGFCSTARKQGKPVFEHLCRALREPDYLLVPFPS